LTRPDAGAGQQCDFDSALLRLAQKAQGESGVLPFPEIGDHLGPALQDMGDLFRLRAADSRRVGQEIRQVGELKPQQQVLPGGRGRAAPMPGRAGATGTDQM